MSALQIVVLRPSDAQQARLLAIRRQGWRTDVRGMLLIGLGYTAEAKAEREVTRARIRELQGLINGGGLVSQLN
jgi:hypothetical protein